MKLLTATAFLGLVTLASSAPALDARQSSDVDCLDNLKYLGGIDGFCEAIARVCNSKVRGITGDIWGVKSCVAAATCVGTRNIYIASNCTEPAVADTPAQVPSLNYNIYAGIVGSCAWQPNGCPITQQQYIDWFYGALTEVNTTAWPDNVEKVIKNWAQIKDWTKTGDTIPYLNFNDWLHYSDSYLQGP